ncbi:twin-arginine translocase TatA/TatE family subunit [Paenibacillus polymyxa]|uniref:Sec-independent protein translocase protein TatA n=1 Tax=Paenibacillus polymyxa TaxID=1406 RepID=A0AAE9I722_PAEPO|nr:twin-arginine translocase TatA/TatE family subunit [Paenibacillus polymyxa]URJ48395.1 twin-arginine translocase TatA/TatE family subunit [Paenibacillus polymyxa]
MPNIGAPGYILLIILALLLFGPNKLPELGRAVGRTFREFKNGARDILSENERTERKDSKDSVVKASPTTSSEVQPQPEDKRLS